MTIIQLIRITESRCAVPMFRKQAANVPVF